MLITNADINAQTVVQGIDAETVNLTFNSHDTFSNKKKDILDWLSPENPYKIHHDVRTKQNLNSNSGNWFLSSKTYLSWRDEFETTSKALWCPGLPGAGKTVMISNIVENLHHLRSRLTDPYLSGLGYLYLGQKSPGESDRSPGAMLRGLLKQLIRDQPTIPLDVEALYDSHHQNETSPRDENVLSVLQAICARHRSVHVLVDALDEYEEAERKVLIRMLISIQANIPAKFKLLLASRFMDNIQSELKSCIRMDITAHDDDINGFVHHQLTLPQNERLADLAKSHDDLRGYICSTIIRESANVFMMAQLQLTLVASKLTLSEVKRALNNLPKTSKDLYQASFDRIRLQDCERRDLALKILTWVCYSLRPLRLQELQHAISLRPSSTHFDPDNIVRREDISAFCAGLVVVTQTDCVTLVHPTAQEYFNDIRETEFQHASNDIVSICATHLSIVSSDQSCDSGTFTTYATGYMGKHVQQAEAMPHTMLDLVAGGHGGGAVQLVQEKSKSVILSNTTYQQLHCLIQNPASKYSMCPEISPMFDSYLSTSPTGRSFGDPTPLHYAATLGMCGIVKLLVEGAHGHSAVNARTWSNETALSIAMKSGFLTIVLYLVQKGARLDLLDETGHEILLLITSRGYVDIANAILAKAVEDAEAHPFRKGSKGVRLLGAAYHRDSEKIKSLFKKSLNHPIRKRDGFCDTAFLIAAHQNDQRSVEELLEQGANISARDAKGRTALHQAAFRNNITLVKFLIGRKAKVDAKDKDGCTPWAEVCTSPDHKEICELLLEHGADPNTRGRYGCSQLYAAAAGGHIEGVRRMLVAGTDPSISTIYGWCPLHWAAHNGHYEVTKLLLEYEANVNSMSDQSKTPLDLAVENEQAEIIELLKSYGAKHSTDIVGRTRMPRWLYMRDDESEDDDNSHPDEISVTGEHHHITEPEESDSEDQSSSGAGFDRVSREEMFGASQNGNEAEPSRGSELLVNHAISNAVTTRTSRSRERLWARLTGRHGRQAGRYFP